MLKRAPKASDDQVIIIAAPEDKLTTLKRCGAPICTPELILTGALRQELCIDEFSLREKSPEFRPERISSVGDTRISLREPFSFAQSNVT